MPNTVQTESCQSLNLFKSHDVFKKAKTYPTNYEFSRFLWPGPKMMHILATLYLSTDYKNVFCYVFAGIFFIGSICSLDDDLTDK
jgi:hypothetical protein